MSVKWNPKPFNRELQGEYRKRLILSGLVVEGNAKKECPVRYGYLRRSIGSDAVDMGDLSVAVGAGGKVISGTNVDYAIHVEEGTRNMPGAHYMKRGLINSYPDIRKIWGIK